MGSQKYYWLKLKKDFFKRHDIKIVEDMPNGKDYILFYLKMLVESIDHDGQLRFSDTIPYNENMLASITNTNIDIVRAAMKIFQELKMIEILDDATIYMVETEKMMGCETEWARKKRDYRNQIKDGNVLKLSDSCPPNVRQEIDIEKDKEIDKEIDIEIDKEIDIEKDINITVSNDTVCQTDVRRIVDEWNALQSFGIKPISKLSYDSKRYKNLIARVKQYGMGDVLKAIDRIKISDFCQGKNKHGWVITFDWFVLPSNFPKVLDGNYDNRNSIENQKYSDFLNS